VIDHGSAWTELAAWVAEEPNRGRQATLAKMAELAQAHTVPEDELERALRLAWPQLVEVLFNRVPQLMELMRAQDGAGSPERGSEADRHSMAAA
jgi:hypothetical protein